MYRSSPRIVSKPQPAPEFLTYREAAKLLRISERTLYSLAKTGQVPHFRLGKLVRFSRPHLERWLEQQIIGPATGRTAAVATDTQRT